MNDPWNRFAPYWWQAPFTAAAGVFAMPAAPENRTEDSSVTLAPPPFDGASFLPSGGLFSTFDRRRNGVKESASSETNGGLLGTLAQAVSGAHRDPWIAIQDAARWKPPILPIQSAFPSAWPNGRRSTNEFYRSQVVVPSNASADPRSAWRPEDSLVAADQPTVGGSSALQASPPPPEDLSAHLLRRSSNSKAAMSHSRLRGRGSMRRNAWPNTEATSSTAIWSACLNATRRPICAMPTA
jgi:hypothetical protein